MASRVNVKFVVILSTVLVLLAAGTGALAWKVVFKSAAQLAAAGDVKLAEGEVRAAEVLYSKAVNKDPYNSAYVLKWENALELWTPETDRELQNEFNGTYVQVQRQLARSDNFENVDYQIQYVELLWELTAFGGFSRQAYESVISTCDEFILLHETMRPEDASWLPLRRYRGLAFARIKLSGLDLSEIDQEQTEGDLQDVLAANPDDYISLESLVAIKRIDAEEARRRGQRIDADSLTAESVALIESFIATNGERSLPGVLATMLSTEITFREEASAIVDEFGPAATPKLEELTEQYRRVTLDLAGQMAAIDPSKITREALRRLYNLESLTDLSRSYEGSLSLMSQVREAHPEDASLALTHANILRERGDFDAAYAELQTVIDRPRLPLGLEGVKLINAKTSAVVGQIQTAVEAHAKAETDEAKANWLARAKAPREALATLVPEASPAIQLLDAKIAVAEGNFVDAQKLVDNYNQITGNSDRDALWISARIAQELGQSGNTRTALERLLEIDPSMAAANVALAEVEYNLGLLEAARDRLIQAQNSNPNDPYVRERLTLIEERLGDRESSDPVRGAIFAAQRAASGSETEIADVAAAIKMLETAIDELGPDPRLFFERARHQILNEDTEAADETIRQGLALYPEDEALNRIAKGLAGVNSVDTLVEMIGESDRTDFQKQISIFAAYDRAGRSDDANRALDAAAQLEPDNPTVLELLFNRAFRANDVAEVKRLTDRARATNADHIDGLSYRARLLLLEGKDDEALAALAQAIAAAPNNTTLLRLLGRTQIRLNRTSDGIASLQRVLEIRPDDLGTVMELCQVLVGENRPDEALEIARRSETFGRANTDFMQMVLTLEGSVGDKTAARDRREKILAARPDDIRNTLALINLYISLGQWDEALGLIEQARRDDAPGVSDSLIALEARWHAEQNDLDAARRAYAKYIAETPPTDRVGPYVALAQFMIQRGSTNAAMTAMQQAIRYQPEGEFRVDAMLGGTLMRFSRFNDAYDVYSRILENDPNADQSVKLRACEALIGMGQYDKAEQVLAGIPNGEADLTVVLLRARIMLQRGDDRAARSALDDAVRRWPDDHRVWILRAEAEARVPDLIPDALADLDRALEIRPSMAEAHRRRAELLAVLGREDEAIAAWQTAVRTNPTNEELRSALVVTLIRRGMEREAVQAANDWFERRPLDAQHRTRIAELFLLGGMRKAATDIYLGAFEIDQNPQLMLRLADLLLSAKPPRLNEAERVFSQAQKVVITNPSLMLARARVFAQTGRMEAAWNDCLGSFQLLTSRDADSMASWFTTMRSVFSNPRETLTFVNRLSSQPGAADWTKLFSARILMGDAATVSEGLSQLMSLIDSTRDPNIKYSALRALAGEYYYNEQYEDALATWKRSLELRPKDWQVENNIAYALATDLDRPSDALPYAENATKHGPNEPEALDTLGTVYLAMDRAADAIPLFENAVRLSRGTAVDAQYMVRLAQAQFASGNRAQAEAVLTEVQGLLDRGRELDEEYEVTRQSLLAELGEG